MDKFRVDDYVHCAWVGDISKLDSYVASDCVFRDVSGETRIEGLETLRAHLRQWRDLFGEVEITIRRQFQDSERSVLVWDWYLSGKPILKRNPHEKVKRVSIYGISFAEIKDGKIVEETNCTDMKEFIDLLVGSRE